MLSFTVNEMLIYMYHIIAPKKTFNLPNKKQLFVQLREQKIEKKVVTVRMWGNKSTNNTAV